MTDEPRKNLTHETDPTGRSPRQLEGDIEQTRAELSETVDELGRKLTPGEIAREAGTAMRDKGREMASRTGERMKSSVKENGLPYALIAGGLAWLWMNSRREEHDRQDRYRYGYDPDYEYSPYRAEYHGEQSSSGERMRGKGAEGRQKASEMASRAKDRVRETRDEASEKLSHATEVGRERAMQARDQFSQMMHEQPLVMAGIGFAIGAAFGALLPSTEMEDRKIGPARDRMLEEAKETGREQMHKAERVAESAKEAAKDKAREEFKGERPGGTTGPTGTPGSPNRPS